MVTKNIWSVFCNEQLYETQQMMLMADDCALVHVSHQVYILIIFIVRHIKYLICLLLSKIQKK
jgi:hypothetical protein